MKLAADKRAALADALEIYENAKLGELGRTADMLRRICSEFGWTFEEHGGFRAWAHSQIDPV